MDEKAHSSKIIKSFEFSRSTSSQSYRSHSSVIDSRGPVGSNFSDKMTNSKRPRISMASDQVQSESHSSVSNPIVEEASENQSHNTSILNRVTNTVSGLFSNVSWSEWLKGASSPIGNENESSLNDNKVDRELPKQDKLPLNQLYPEEGIAGVNLDMASGSSLQGSGDKSDISMKLNISSFKDQSVISSTPSLSLYNKKRRANEEYLCDSIISKPSTSDFCREVLPPQENCINLLKMSFPESNSENYNGSMNTFPSSRKRLRENLEEDDTACDDSYQNISKKRPLQQSQLLSEEIEVPTSIKRKRPRFSISTYGSPLLSKQAEEEEPSFSIFYPGKIMFGGASNHQRKKNRIIPRKICPRTPATNMANVDDHSDGGLSSAARRILDCIDKISTPLSASKRAFQFNNPRDYSFSNTTFVADFHKHKPSSKTSSDVQSPPITKLLTPSKVKITRNFSSLFEAKTADNSTKQHEIKASNATTSKESNGHSKVSPFKFTSPAFVNSTQKEMLTPKTNQFTSMKSFVNKTSSSSVDELDKKTTNNSVPTTASFDERLKSAMSKFASKKFEPKPLTVNKDSKAEFTFKNSDTDNAIQYSFSKPGVVSGLMGEEEIIPECTVEFKFSQPINEVESTANKDAQPLKFSFKKNAGSWECDTCLLQNKSEAESCVACLSSKPVKASSQVEPQPKINPFKKEVGSWDCDTCLLRNKGEDEKCVACLSFKPSKSSKSSFNIDPQPLINLFRKENGSWDCNSCLLRNKNEDEKCVACSAARRSNSTSKPVIEGFKGNWGDSFKSSKGAWDCEMCLLQNKESASNCAACETPKPVSGQKKSVSNVFSGMATSASSWGDPFKPIDESWLCETCKMKNTLSTVACAGCKTQKNNQKNDVDGSNNKSLNYSFGISSKETLKDSLSEKLKQDSQKDIEINWICPECLTSNKNTDLKCSSCSCSKSTMNDTLKGKSTPLPLTGFGSQFSKSKDEWECDTCLIRNKSTAQKCASCATPKSGATHSTIVSEVMTGNFKFGVNASQSKSEAPCKINFGTISKPSDVNKLSTFKLGSNPEPAKEATSSILKFGIDSKPAETEASKISFLSAEKKDTPFIQNSSTDKDIIPPATSKFVFGTPIPSTTLTIPSISITTASTDTSFSLKTPIVATETKKNDDPITSEEIKTKPLFQFGTTALPNTQTEAKKLEFPKINSTSTNQSDSLTQLPKVNPSTFSFFGNKSNPTSQVTFGNSDSNTSNKGFSFDKKEKNTPSITFNFGNVDANKSSTASFNFGTVDSKPNPVFSFGGGESNKPSTSLFQFGSGAPTSSAITFGQQQSGNAFGAPAAQPAKTASAPLHLSIPENSNPFNVLASSSAMPGEPPKRVIKKANRRLRQ